LRRVPLRIDGDEDRNNLRRLIAELVERLGDDLQLRRADVRAMGEPEEHEQVAATEVPVGNHLAVGAGEREGAAADSFARYFYRLAARRPGDDEDGSASQRPDKKARDDERD